MKELTDKQKKEYDKFMNEQFEILQGHHLRCMLRCHNKLMQLASDKI